MAKRILWDMSEAVIMLDALIAAREGRISRKDAIESVSLELRDRAKQQGIEIDDQFRNINGITLQMSIMEFILTNGEKGLGKPSMPKFFQDAVAMYQNDRALYEKTLKDARYIKSRRNVQEQYFAWLATKVYPPQLSGLYAVYADIENFCLMRSVIKNKLFELSNLADIRKVMDTVESNKVFRFTYKQQLDKMRSAIRFYYCFMKEHPEFLDISIPEKPSVSLKLEKVKSAETTSNLGECKTIDISTRIDMPIHQVDFTNIQSLANTQPKGFSYFGIGQIPVNTWTELYVQVVTCLLEDYPRVLHSYINRNIDGQGQYDFADEIGMGAMKQPRKVRDNFYMETNVGAVNIIKRIKKLLDRCKVGYENLIIRYCSTDRSAAPAAVATSQTDDCGHAAESKNSKEDFINWMQQAGLPADSICGHVSAIEQLSKAVIEYGICHEELFLIDDPARLQQILDCLLNVSAFRGLNAQQHNRFRAAISKLIDYRSSLSPVISVPQEVKESIPDATASSEYRETASSAADPVIKRINFMEKSLAYTQPRKFSYFDEIQAQVTSWTDLYVQVVQCLLEDYPDTLRSYINRNINGKNRYDFADKNGVNKMKEPREIQDNFYLETNYSATDIVKKIKKLLDLCRVDYENLEILYCQKKKLARSAIVTMSQNDAGAKDFEKNVHEVNSQDSLEETQSQYTESLFPKLAEMAPEPVTPSETGASAADSAIKRINFRDISSLEYTKPREFSYFDEVREQVASWKDLYVQVVQCLLEDYPDTLKSYLHCNINGKGPYDFADEFGMRNMRAPRKIQDNFYLETNFSAANVVKKIKRLLDLCHVDYENLEVLYYAKEKSAASFNISMPVIDHDVSPFEKKSRR